MNVNQAGPLIVMGGLLHRRGAKRFVFEDIDFSPGSVTYDGTAFLDQEDVLQVSYEGGGGNLTLDIGWYGNEFAVVVVKDYDWEHPLLEKRCAGTEELRAAVWECAEYARAVWEKEAARHADSFIGSNRSDG